MADLGTLVAYIVGGHRYTGSILMARLPQISGQECRKALEKADFYFVRRSGGNHMYMRRDNPFAQVSIPDHRVLGRGVLRTIIRDAGMTVDEFIALL